MIRDTALDQIENTKEPWDFLVIGGGATGLGVAVDASAGITYGTTLEGRCLQRLGRHWCQPPYQM
jgi:hypothetical protein